ncbi:unnamed protein product [Bursaphelenchus okinawaensis]|uniref:Uncharacterized protein n=1 Tax=Bursaphelenchus okinawaensis TaxID=465554 RepID=A0A811LAA7_9BILA|nr:unnamed protein product [Bursaphelenchus okinawaensis]CAG9120030.1 unnamed protein product [Bursaphelenchus okinawaensis]
MDESTIDITLKLEPLRARKPSQLSNYVWKPVVSDKNPVQNAAPSSKKHRRSRSCSKSSQKSSKSCSKSSKPSKCPKATKKSRVSTPSVGSRRSFHTSEEQNIKKEKAQLKTARDKDETSISFRELKNSITSSLSKRHHHTSKHDIKSWHGSNQGTISQFAQFTFLQQKRAEARLRCELWSWFVLALFIMALLLYRTERIAETCQNAN